MLPPAADRPGAAPSDLHRPDLERSLRPDWFQLPGMVGYAAYADPASASTSCSTTWPASTSGRCARGPGEGTYRDYSLVYPDRSLHGLGGSSVGDHVAGTAPTVHDGAVQLAPYAAVRLTG